MTLLARDRTLLKLQAQSFDAQREVMISMYQHL